MTTTDDVIRLAKAAGATLYADTLIVNGRDGHDFCARLIALAKAEEREACIAACEAIEDKYQRKESGKWPELKSDAQTGASDCAAAIRARSKEQT